MRWVQLKLKPLQHSKKQVECRMSNAQVLCWLRVDCVHAHTSIHQPGNAACDLQNCLMRPLSVTNCCATRWARLTSLHDMQATSGPGSCMLAQVQATLSRQSAYLRWCCSLLADKPSVPCLCKACIRHVCGKLLLLSAGLLEP